MKICRGAHEIHIGDGHMFLKIRIYEYIIVSILNIVTSFVVLHEDPILDRIIAPFFVIGVFFVLFLYAPASFLLQFLSEKFITRNSIVTALVPSVTFAAISSWVVLTWSNPLPSVGLIWAAIGVSVLSVFVINVSMLRGR